MRITGSLPKQIVKNPSWDIEDVHIKGDKAEIDLKVA